MEPGIGFWHPGSGARHMQVSGDPLLKRGEGGGDSTAPKLYIYTHINIYMYNNIKSLYQAVREIEKSSLTDT